MTRRSFIALLMLLGVAMGLVACEKKAPPAAPTNSAAIDPRIVVLSPALAVILRDLGLEGRIVGRHAWDLCLPESVPICGDQAGIDYEAVLQAAPTHVVIQWGKRELPQRLRELGEARHWTIVPLDPLSLDEVVGAARALEREFDPWIDADHKGAHSPAAQLERALATPEPTATRAGRVLLLTNASPPTALGPGSFHADVLGRLGGVAALTGGGAYVTLDAEDVLRMAPEGIVLIEPRGVRSGPTLMRNRAADFDASDLRMRLGKLAELDIPAIRAGRVALIDDPLSLTPSTAMVGFAVRLRGILGVWSGGEENHRDTEAQTKQDRGKR